MIIMITIKKRIFDDDYDDDDNMIFSNGDGSCQSFIIFPDFPALLLMMI